MPSWTGTPSFWHTGEGCHSVPSCRFLLLYRESMRSELHDLVQGIALCKPYHNRFLLQEVSAGAWSPPHQAGVIGLKEQQATDAVRCSPLAMTLGRIDQHWICKYHDEAASRLMAEGSCLISQPASANRVHAAVLVR